MKSYAARTEILGLIVACVITLESSTEAMGGLALGVSAPVVTVMPSPDPWIYSLPGIAFNPKDTSTTLEYFTKGDYFTVSGTPLPGFGKLTLNDLDIGPLSDFKVTASSLGKSDQLKFVYTGSTFDGTLGDGTGLFDALTIGDISFDAFDFTSAIEITYHDSVYNIKKGTTSKEVGSNTTLVTPEPATLVMAAFGAVAGLFLLTRNASQRRRAIA